MTEIQRALLAVFRDYPLAVAVRTGELVVSETKNIKTYSQFHGDVVSQLRKDIGETGGTGPVSLEDVRSFYEGLISEDRWWDERDPDERHGLAVRVPLPPRAIGWIAREVERILNNPGKVRLWAGSCGKYKTFDEQQLGQLLLGQLGQPALLAAFRGRGNSRVFYSRDHGRSVLWDGGVVCKDPYWVLRGIRMVDFAGDLEEILKYHPVVDNFFDLDWAGAKKAAEKMKRFTKGNDAVLGLLIALRENR